MTCDLAHTLKTASSPRNHRRRGAESQFTTGRVLGSRGSGSPCESGLAQVPSAPGRGCCRVWPGWNMHDVSDRGSPHGGFEYAVVDRANARGRQLREDLLETWVAVTDAGGSVGFAAPADRAQIAETLDLALERVADGSDALGVVTRGGTVVGMGFLVDNGVPTAATLAHLAAADGAPRAARLRRRPDAAGRPAPDGSRAWLGTAAADGARRSRVGALLRALRLHRRGSSSRRDPGGSRRRSRRGHDDRKARPATGAVAEPALRSSHER